MTADAAHHSFWRTSDFIAVLVIVVGAAVERVFFWSSGLSMHLLLVLPEERYLEERLPDEYPAYMARVRRWL